MEALALGTPVVTTSAGNSGIGGAEGRELLVADDVAEFGGHVSQLLAGQRWQDMSDAGRALVSRFFWDRSAAVMEKEIQSISEIREAPTQSQSRGLRG